MRGVMTAVVGVVIGVALMLFYMLILAPAA
jgi:hypothetical protein